MRKGLRCLYRDELLTVDGADHEITFHSLERVRDRNARDRSVRAVAHGGDHRVEEGAGCKRPRGIMHQHDLRTVRYASESGANRL